ncbi:GntR family transcriptional regulator [Marinomonas ushuaiensis DSM 15871]|uniref:GntR family transcriptional regulator n=1 Tax=Marinomonas ushuaiensis DSM 15871 TaxID=1122207 RepID=X7E8L6_9GAMM|nr:GntR family transcriptional regulator [Marinomonas ushuaiensis]ETX12384.1 GntR family transcriptional regulator [Marinomonas ushuaiensis DSM 15871]
MAASSLNKVENLSGSLSQRVYQSLREAILSMQFPPGTVIRKGAICEQLGVSRSPVAEALARLSTEGLVDIIPQSATKVSCFSMDEIREASFLRQALEIAAVEKVTLERTPKQLAALTRNIRMQELLIEDKDFVGFYEADEEFHTMLMNFTGFNGVPQVLESVSLHLTRARMLVLPDEGRPKETVKEHRAILAAIKNQDVDAAREAMKSHIGQLIPRILPLEESHAEYFKP